MILRMIRHLIGRAKRRSAPQADLNRIPLTDLLKRLSEKMHAYWPRENPPINPETPFTKAVTTATLIRMAWRC
jgi:hypothetical protein